MKNDERIALRLPAKEREALKQLVETGEFNNLSHVIRTAISKFTSEQRRVTDAAE